MSKFSFDKKSLICYYWFSERFRNCLLYTSKNRSLAILPSIQAQISGFNGEEKSFSFSWTASIVERTSEQEAELREKLLAQIEFLQKEIARVQAQIKAILAQQRPVLCQRFENNLYFGMRNNAEVRCLQQFLKAQGQEIYPEGLVTGNFLSLTVSAVKRYQAKKGIIQTGYFGPLTRTAANQDLSR